MILPFALIESTRGPYIVRSHMSPSDLVGKVEIAILPLGFKLFVLNGEEMKTAKGMFSEFARVMSFPDYFGHNSHALMECLADLSWVESAGYCVIILSSESIFSDESRSPHYVSDLEWFVSAADSNGESWLDPDAEDWWQTDKRKPTPFHFILQCDVDNKKHFPEVFMSLPQIE